MRKIFRQIARNVQWKRDDRGYVFKCWFGEGGYVEAYFDRRVKEINVRVCYGTTY